MVVLSAMTITLLICCVVISIIVKDIKRYGFMCGNVVGLALLLFYFFIPIVYLSFPQARNKTTLFNILLGQNSKEEICGAVLICVILVLEFMLGYKVSKRGMSFSTGLFANCKKKASKIEWKQINHKYANRIERVADITFFLGGASIIICIFALGGLNNYLALGSITRGINKNVNDVLDSSILPLITLSSIVLTAPFLYRYLQKVYPNVLMIKIKHITSFVISIIFLLYNQGRVPVLLFLIPYVLDIKALKRMKVTSVIMLSLVCIFLLEPLSNLFTYISYGRVVTSEGANFFEILLLEFTYPFSNFVNKSELIGAIGDFRYGLDFVQWPLTLIPNTLLKILGFSKSAISSIGSLNTNAYIYLTGMKAGGGIPVDIFTFCYYQVGWISLILLPMVFAWMLKSIDKRFVFLRENEEVRVILLRVCFLMISLINNFDLAVIFRTRFDLVVLIGVIFYISRKGNNLNEGESFF